MRPKALALLFVLYAAVGTALLATPLAAVGFLMAVLVAFLLGAAWPSHWGFPAAGVVLGVGAAGLFGLLIFGLGLMQNNLLALILYAAASAFYAGIVFAVWLVIMLLGVLSAWLARRVFRQRPLVAG